MRSAFKSPPQAQAPRTLRRMAIAAAGAAVLLFVATSAALSSSVQAWPQTTLKTQPRDWGEITNAAAAPMPSGRIGHRAARRRPIVYVYDWPSFCFNASLCTAPTIQAASNASCQTHRTMWRRDGFECFSNHGMGLRLNASLMGLDLFDTPQFAAKMLFDWRLNDTAWRTFDPWRATLFYIPYSPAPLLDHYRFASHSKASSLFSVKWAWFKSHVVEAPWFKRNMGRDHFIVEPRARAFATESQASLYDSLLANVTKLTIETHRMHIPRVDLRTGVSIAVSSKTGLVTRWASVPYPTNLHPRADSPDWQPCSFAKDVLVAMAFSAQHYLRAR